MQVPARVVVALVLALLLNSVGRRSSGFFRTVFFLPKMTPPVAVGILFLLLFNGQNGSRSSARATRPTATTQPSSTSAIQLIVSRRLVYYEGETPS